MRVLAYNVRGVRQDRSALLSMLRAAEADVVALQEPPRWWFPRARLAGLARGAGLRVVVPGGLTGARTCALLVRGDTQVLGRRALRLPLRIAGRSRAGWYPTFRGAALARLAMPGPGRPVTVVSVHLSLDPVERADHLRRIVAAVRRLTGGDLRDLVVAGDLNERPDGPAWRALARLGLHDAGLADDRATFPASSPRRRIDAVWLGEGLEVRPGVGPGAAGLPFDPARAALASDHLPVVADVVGSRLTGE